MKIRKDDKVVVISGRDKGKEGTILSADPKNNKGIVDRFREPKLSYALVKRLFGGK